MLGRIQTQSRAGVGVHVGRSLRRGEAVETARRQQSRPSVAVTMVTASAPLAPACPMLRCAGAALAELAACGLVRRMLKLFVAKDQQR